MFPKVLIANGIGLEQPLPYNGLLGYRQLAWQTRRSSPAKWLKLKAGGEGGIRTLGTGVSPYNGLANRRIRPLCHLSGVAELQFTTAT